MSDEELSNLYDNIKLIDYVIPDNIEEYENLVIPIKNEVNKLICKELEKAINELPKAETNNTISAMNSVNVDDLMSAIDRFNKVPTYQDLLEQLFKENKQLKEIQIKPSFTTRKLKQLEQENKQLKEKIDDVITYINYIVIFNQNINGRLSETLWGQEILEILKGE